MSRPIFARRHYEIAALAIQEAVAGCKSSGEIHGVYIAARELANAFARDNGSFKRERFEGACYPGANVKARSHPLERLRYHVTGAIERGEKEPIVGIPQRGGKQ